LSALRTTLKSEAEKRAVARRLVSAVLVREPKRLSAPVVPLVVVTVVPLVEFVWVVGAVLEVVVPLDAIWTT
jgi:hypothetical protein